MSVFAAETLVVIDALVAGGTRRIDRQRLLIADMTNSGSDTLREERYLMVMEADLCAIHRIRAHVLRDVA